MSRDGIVVCFEFAVYVVPRMASLPGVFLFAVGVTAVLCAGVGGSADSPHAKSLVDPTASVVEVFYTVDPKELFSMVVVILMTWEFMKWLLAEAGKTVFIDWVLRKLFSCCGRPKPAPVSVPEKELAHGLRKIYKLSKRADYRVHLFDYCHRLEGGTPIEQQICTDCLSDLQAQLDSMLFSVVEYEVDAALKRHGVRA